MTTKTNKSAKVLLCGMKNVGKTTLVEQLIYGNVTLEKVSNKNWCCRKIFIQPCSFPPEI